MVQLTAHPQSPSFRELYTDIRFLGKKRSYSKTQEMATSSGKIYMTVHLVIVLLVDTKCIWGIIKHL